MLVALMVLAVGGFLGAMQVIGTEAQGDQDMLRELSVELAEAADGDSPFLSSSPVISSAQSSAASSLSGGTEPIVEPAAELEPPAEQDQQTEAQEAETSPEPTPEPTSTPEPSPVAMDGCTPAGSGAPYCIYVVEQGDTLSQVAENLGMVSTSAFSGAELLALSNGLNNAQNWLITPGQELRVPIESGVIHTVSETDTVSVLAEIYGVTTTEIIASNNFADPNHIPVGDEIIVPSPELWPWTGPSDTALATSDTSEDDEEAQSSSETEESSETAVTSSETTEEASEPPTEEPENTPEPATATSEPTPERRSSSGGGNPSVSSVRDQFAEGYIAGGGPPQYLEHILASVIGCESGYNVRAYNPAGPFYGLMQFLPETWARTGGGDWFDAWQQGHNTAVLLQGSTPSSQWPHCWG